MFILIIHSCDEMSIEIAKFNTKPSIESVDISNDSLVVKAIDNDGDMIAYQYYVEKPDLSVEISNWSKFYSSDKSHSLYFDYPDSGMYKFYVTIKDEMNTLSDKSIIKEVIYSPSWMIQNNGNDNSYFSNGYNFKRIYFLNSLIGFAIASDRYGWNGPDLFVTYNGGKDFKRIYDDVCDFKFINENVGWFIRQSYDQGWKFSSYLTNNGGETWNSLYQEGKCYFINDNMGWMATFEYKYNPLYKWFFNISQTNNGGISWKKKYSIDSLKGIKLDNSCAFDIAYFNDAIGIFAIYNFEKNKFYICRTKDGGSTWSIVYENNHGPIVELSLINDNFGFINFGGSYLYTLDGGVNWNEKEFKYIKKMFFKDEKNGWALTEKPIVDNQGGISNNYYTIFKTTNGGINWKKTQNHYWFNDTPYNYDLVINNIFFINDNMGWICTSNSLVRTNR
jgi:hypothetical protein